MCAHNKNSFPIIILDSSDYANGTYSYTFEADQTRICQGIGISDDNVLESVEEFEVILSANTEPSAVVNPSRAVVKITDNDGIINTYNLLLILS